MKSIRVPEGLKLRDYQVEGVKHLMSGQRKMLFDDVGLGKTAQSLVALNSLGAKTTLILCPPSTKYGWEREAQRWTDRDYKIHVMSKEVERIPTDVNICIVPYSLLSSPMIIDQLKDRRWSVTIIDEIHYVKNTSSNRSNKTISRSGVAPKSVYMWGLTATPLVNGPIDMWPFFRSMGKEHLPTKCRDWMGYTRYFCARYKEAHSGRWNVKGASNLPVLNKALYNTGFAMRRTKEQVLKELPAKQYRVIPMRRKDKAISINYDVELLKSKVRLGIMGEEIAQARRELGIEKLPSVLEYLDEVKEPCVVFGWHTEFLESVAKHTGGQLYYGSMTSAAKERAKQDFIDGKVQFLLANIVSAGTGLDGLQHRSSHCIFAELPWTYTEVDQASGRLHRMGQTNPVLADILCVEGGIEEYVLQTILGKQESFKKVIDKTTELINIK